MCLTHRLPGQSHCRKCEGRAEVYDIAGLASLLEVDQGLIRQWRKRGKLPPEDFTVAGHPAWWSSTIAAWRTELERL